MFDYVFQMLYVSNAGLGNGMSRELVYSWLSGYATLTNIVMAERKPYCFVVTADVNGAEVITSLNGSAVQHVDGRPPVLHHLAFVSQSELPLASASECSPCIWTFHISIMSRLRALKCLH